MAVEKITFFVGAGVSFPLVARLTVQRFAIDTVAGAPDAFETIIALHEPRIRRLAHRLLGWRGGDDVEDVVQDVFLTALEKIGSFRGDAHIGTWLTRVAINRVRTQRRKALLQFRWLRRAGSNGACPFANPADASALCDETSARVREAVQQLSASDREVIVLFHLEAMPVAEIAKLLEFSPNAIEVRLHRARRRLKDKLGDLMND
jgi:RNA polymerase sigma-70 factor (ECF subfamily)